MTAPHLCPPCSGNCHQGRACRNGSHILGSDWPHVYDTERARQARLAASGHEPPREQFEDYLDDHSAPRLRALDFRRATPPTTARRRPTRQGNDHLASVQRIVLAVALVAALIAAVLAGTDYTRGMVARVQHATTGGR
jgi:hypothetical protein